MTILLLPIFLFGLVISWIVYLGVQQANETTLATQRIPLDDANPKAAVADEPTRVVAQKR
jgi:hypothetical protein